ncbi:5-formyltetrahydrofolate cyclo-ligase [Gammaproteobacteria bacterium]
MKGLIETKQIRREMRSRRRLLSPDKRLRSALALAKNVGKLWSFRNANRMAMYLPNDGEIDPKPLIKRATDAGKVCYLPVLCPLGGKRLWFAPYRLGGILKPNRFSIPEPIHSRRVRARSLDLILVPLVAFDPTGNRIGMGGGYYDQTLAFLSRRKHWRVPRTIGIAYDFQCVPQIESRPWDMPLDAVVTEVKCYSGGGGGGLSSSSEDGCPSRTKLARLCR